MAAVLIHSDVYGSGYWQSKEGRQVWRPVWQTLNRANVYSYLLWHYDDSQEVEITDYDEYADDATPVAHVTFRVTDGSYETSEFKGDFWLEPGFGTKVLYGEW